VEMQSGRGITYTNMVGGKNLGCKYQQRKFKHVWNGSLTARRRGSLFGGEIECLYSWEIPDESSETKLYHT